jgi:hypothetical protein
MYEDNLTYWDYWTYEDYCMRIILHMGTTGRTMTTGNTGCMRII